MKEKETVELQEVNAILKIPANAATLELTAVVLGDDGKPIKVGRTLSVQDVFAARKAFLDAVPYGDEYDARWVVTEAGAAFAKELGLSDAEVDDVK